MTFKGHCPHDLNDSAERPFIFITVLIFKRERESGPGYSDDISAVNSQVMFL